MSLSVPPRPAPRARLLPGLSLRVGDILGSRYRLDSLTTAERSRVHIAGTQIMNRAPVAIEIFVPNGEGSDEARIAFVAASRRAAIINGPHTAKVLHSGVTPDGHPFVAREPVPARTLAALLTERGSLETSEAVDITIALCDAVGEAHGHGMLHGAIEPRNVRLGPNEVKLLDFETASIFIDMALDPFARLVMKAPEQLRIGGRMDERTDVFALGALLFTMIAGASPFAAESPSATALALNNDDPAFLAGVDDALADLVEQCLSKDPVDRPVDVTAVAEALAPFASPKSKDALDRIRDRAAVLSSPTVMVRAQDYEALAGERQSSVEIEIEWSDIEVVTPPPMSRSIKPVAFDIAPPPASLQPKKSSPFRYVGIALGLAAGIAIGAVSEQFIQPSETANAVSAPPPSIDPQPGANDLTGIVETTAATATATATATAEPVAKPTPKPSSPPPSAITPAKAPAAPAPLPSKIETKSPATENEPAAKPAAAAAPKENDEDLRHYLDDRR